MAVSFIGLIFPAALWAQPSALALNEPLPGQQQQVANTVMGILSYSRWPATTKPDAIRLCVIAPVKFANGLVAGNNNLTGKRLTVQYLSPESPALLTDCDALYSGPTSADQQHSLHNRLAGHPVLTISEKDDDCALLNAFCLDVGPAHVGFKLNLDTLARSGVRVHPNVLQLAREKE
ncbi:YfiR family protein [Ewingella americana]|jgi:hypothetical protein|nr:YfiR family protein [Ewingella americana]